MTTLTPSLIIPGNAFPKSTRILKSAAYKHLHLSGTRLYGQHVKLHVRRKLALPSQLGITVSKKYGKAHERNRFKRIVRESFRRLRPLMEHPFEINVSPAHPVVKGSPPSMHLLLEEIKSLMHISIDKEASHVFPSQSSSTTSRTHH